MRQIVVVMVVLGLAVTLGWGAGSPKAAGPSVADGYKSPTVVVPYAHTKPTIDGTIHDEEWQGAVSFRALQTTSHAVSLRQTRFWFTWDEDTLYVAMRSPLRPGERVQQSLRRRVRDINVVFDDSYEIWLDVGGKDPGTGLISFVQFLCNYAGARLDTLHLPSVGNSRMGYETGWEPKNRITENNEWEWELAIPRQSIYLDQPLTDGFKFTCLVARNYKRPWEQNSFEGTSTFAVNETHSHFVLSKNAPAVHLLGVGDPKERTLGIDLAAFGSAGDDKIAWRYVSDSGVEKTGVVAVKKGETTRIQPQLALEPAAEKPTGKFRITVSSADGKTTYLDWAASNAYGVRKDLPETLDDLGDVVKLTAALNPVHDYVRVMGDFIQYDARAAIAAVRARILDAQGTELATESMKIDEIAYVEGSLQLRDLPYGTYKVELTCLDADGEEILTRDVAVEKKDHEKSFPWWNTPHGNIERVIEPWTPVTYEKGTFGVWGRSMQLGTCGLPARVTTQGMEILAAPAKLVAETPDGKTCVATAAGEPRVVSQTEHRTVVSSDGRIGSLNVTSDVQVEFDGMYKVTMTLTPDKPMTVKSLRVVLPYTHEAADYVHAAGEGIRTGYYYGFLPKEGQGSIWDCKTVTSQPMVVGSFIPYLWIGTTKGGLCWFADSDQGWVPSNTTPAIEIRRDGDRSTDLVLNLISEEFTIDAPRTITFAFQASPVKQMHKGWRESKWWCGHTFYDFAGSGSTIWQAIPYPRDVEKSKAMVEQFHKQNKLAVPYFIHQTLPPNLVPEMKYFGDEWRTSISECLYYGKTLTDYMVHSYAEWAKSCGIDGYYVDNMRPVVCDNLKAGRGYTLPDGRVQPTYQMFSTREYFLRIRAAFLEQGKSGNIVLHMTNNMILPWVGPADIAYDGEHYVIYESMEKDFMDFWTLERMRVDYPGQWGVAVNFMAEYQGPWDPVRYEKVWRAYIGMVILHDALPYGNDGYNRAASIKAGRVPFGITEDDVEFVGYWVPDSGLKCDSKDVYLAAWKRPGKLLLAVVNTGETADAQVALDPAKLGLGDPKAWKVTDTEAQSKVQGKYDPKTKTREVVWDGSAAPAITHDAAGTLTVPVDRHDFRHILIETGQE